MWDHQSNRSISPVHSDGEVAPSYADHRAFLSGFRPSVDRSASAKQDKGQHSSAAVAISASDKIREAQERIKRRMVSLDSTMHRSHHTTQVAAATKRADDVLATAAPPPAAASTIVTKTAAASPPTRRAPEPPLPSMSVSPTRSSRRSSVASQHTVELDFSSPIPDPPRPTVAVSSYSASLQSRNAKPAPVEVAAPKPTSNTEVPTQKADLAPSKAQQRVLEQRTASSSRAAKPSLVSPPQSRGDTVRRPRSPLPPPSSSLRSTHFGGASYEDSTDPRQREDRIHTLWKEVEVGRAEFATTLSTAPKGSYSSRPLLDSRTWSPERQTLVAVRAVDAGSRSPSRPPPAPPVATAATIRLNAQQMIVEEMEAQFKLLRHTERLKRNAVATSEAAEAEGLRGWHIERRSALASRKEDDLLRAREANLKLREQALAAEERSYRDRIARAGSSSRADPRQFVPTSPPRSTSPHGMDLPHPQAYYASYRAAGPIWPAGYTPPADAWGIYGRSSSTGTNTTTAGGRGSSQLERGQMQHAKPPLPSSQIKQLEKAARAQDIDFDALTGDDGPDDGSVSPMTAPASSVVKAVRPTDVKTHQQQSAALHQRAEDDAVLNPFTLRAINALLDDERRHRAELEDDRQDGLIDARRWMSLTQPRPPPTQDASTSRVARFKVVPPDTAPQNAVPPQKVTPIVFVPHASNRFAVPHSAPSAPSESPSPTRVAIHSQPAGQLPPPSARAQPQMPRQYVASTDDGVPTPDASPVRSVTQPRDSSATSMTFASAPQPRRVFIVQTSTSQSSVASKTTSVAPTARHADPQASPSSKRSVSGGLPSQRRSTGSHHQHHHEPRRSETPRALQAPSSRLLSAVQHATRR